jgi:F-type H+-transporting ATPase subunit b
MNALFAQLGDLVLGSLPTAILFLLLIAAYAAILQAPLRRTLAQRRERTSGAVSKAEQAIAEADKKTREYEDRLRAARAEIAARRDAQVKEWTAARDGAAASAREAASARVQEARTALQAQTDAAREQIHSGADALAEQILQSLLPAGARG